MAVVGTVTVLSGHVVATHSDGTLSTLAIGSPISQGDVIETGAEAAVNVLFVDDTTLSMGEGSRLEIDAFVFDPGGAPGSAAIRLAEGFFIVVAGAVAAGGPEAFVLTTPVATIGIRGTSLAILAGPEGTRNLVVLLEDPLGDLGKAVVSNVGGARVLDDVNEATAVTSFNVEPALPFLLSRHQLEDLFRSAILASPFHGRLHDDIGTRDLAPPNVAGPDEGRPTEGAQAVDSVEQAPGEILPGTVTAPDIVSVPGQATSEVTGALGGVFGPGLSTLSLAGVNETAAFDSDVPESGGATSDSNDVGSSSGGDRNQFVPSTGDDTIGGGEPVESVIGGIAGDTLVGTEGIDDIFGSAGNDVLEGRCGNDLLDGGDGRDLVLGEAGDDALFGSAEDDSLAGGPGNDLLDGGPGKDTALHDDAMGPVDVSLNIAGPQAVGGGLGADDLRGIEQLSGSPFGDVLTGDAADNNLQGRAGDDRLFGDGGNDEMFGDTGRDSLFGGLGNDFLLGSEEGDDVTGGPGADGFVFSAFDHGAVVAANVTSAAAGKVAGVDYDRFLDFSVAQGDLVALEAAVFGLAQNILLISGSNFSTISVPYDGTNAENDGANAEFAAGRPSAIFSTADATLSFDPDGVTPGYTVLAEVNVPLDATDIRTF